MGKQDYLCFVYFYQEREQKEAGILSDKSLYYISITMQREHNTEKNVQHKICIHEEKKKFAQKKKIQK